MTYVKPRAFTRWLVNPIVAKLRPRGVATLTVTGRRSGVPRRVPIILFVVDNTHCTITAYSSVASRVVDRFFSRLPDPRDHPVLQLTSPDAPPEGSAE